VQQLIPLAPMHAPMHAPMQRSHEVQLLTPLAPMPGEHQRIACALHTHARARVQHAHTHMRALTARQARTQLRAAGAAEGRHPRAGGAVA